MRFTAPALPDFPWDTIQAEDALARAHPDGICDLSVGTPVDPVPDIAQRALVAAADSPGYPTVWGTPDLRAAIIAYLTSRWGATGLSDRHVATAVGGKELVAWLPTLLGLGPGQAIVVPPVAYPTYAVGAAMVGADIVAAASPGEVGDRRPGLIWLNSPGNPTGQIDDLDRIRAWVDFARDSGALLAADECYGEYGWTAEPVSILDARVNGGTTDGLLAVHSLSKRSNLAGYRAGFMAGDPDIVMGLVGLRKHLGMMVAAPVQAAMTVLLGDQTHVAQQRQRYLARRQRLGQALATAGFRIDGSQGGLYLWATRGQSGRTTTHWLAERGILVAPGDFYGPTGVDHVRIALTATDERITAAADRLA